MPRTRSSFRAAIMLTMGLSVGLTVGLLFGGVAGFLIGRLNSNSVVQLEQPVAQVAQAAPQPIPVQVDAPPRPQAPQPGNDSTPKPQPVKPSLAAPVVKKAADPVPALQLVKTVEQPFLSPDEFAQMHALIKPQPGEWKFATVNWANTVQEAREQAAKEGKPILIWYMVGEPLGQC
jgi:hypothetical protein